MAKNTGTTTFNKCARLFGAFAIIILTVAAAGAATFTVSSTADTGLGTLRQAVTDANAATSNDTIVFNIPAASCNATTGVCTITLASEITISNNGSLTISGTGANRLTIDGGAGTNRIFYALSTILNISGVTLTGGNSTGASFSGQGAAILTNGGTLTLKSVVVTGNSNSTNIESGGAVTMLSGSNHVIINSTISNNTDRDCGGLDFISNTGTVTNTTISGNVINGVGIPVGGGFCVLNGTVTMLNSTVTGNSESDGGSYGGGAAYISGTLNISNSIVAGNIAPVHADFENDGTIISQGYNLIGENSDSSGAFPAGNPNANNDIVGTSGSPVNPLLDALANYGGTIPTRRPQTTSPAIDKGSAVTGVSSDGRGVIRPFDNPSIVNATGGNGADIGAFELETSIIKDWGFNQYGQLGLGNTNDQYTPLTLSGLKDITQFGGGNNHSIVLLADGSVRTSGDNSSGQQGIGTFSGNRSTYGTVMGTNVANITQVSGGGYHSVALRSDGTVWAWGTAFSDNSATVQTIAAERQYRSVRATRHLTRTLLPSPLATVIISPSPTTVKSGRGVLIMPGNSATVHR